MRRPPGGWKDKSPEDTAFYRSRAWRLARAATLRRDMGLCQSCLRAGRTTPANHVDHITPRAQGGGEDEDNLQSLCAECHDEKTRQDNGARRQTIGLDGWPVQSRYVAPISDERRTTGGRR